MWVGTRLPPVRVASRACIRDMRALKHRPWLLLLQTCASPTTCATVHRLSTASSRTEPCPYTLLRLRPSASNQEVKAAFRKRALELHPDVKRGTVSDPEAFLKVVAAYELLSDPQRRAAYDQEQQQQQQHSSNGHTSAGTSPPHTPGPYRAPASKSTSLTHQASRNARSHDVYTVPDEELLTWRYGVGSWLAHARASPTRRLEPGEESVAGRVREALRRYQAVMETDLGLALTRAYLGPKLRVTEQAPLPHCFEAEQRTHPTASPDLFHLVSGRTVIGRVSLQPPEQLHLTGAPAEPAQLQPASQQQPLTPAQPAVVGGSDDNSQPLEAASMSCAHSGSGLLQEEKDGAGTQSRPADAPCSQQADTAATGAWSCEHPSPPPKQLNSQPLESDVGEGCAKQPLSRSTQAAPQDVTPTQQAVGPHLASAAHSQPPVSPSPSALTAAGARKHRATAAPPQPPGLLSTLWQLARQVPANERRVQEVRALAPGVDKEQAVQQLELMGQYSRLRATLDAGRYLSVGEQQLLAQLQEQRAATQWGAKIQGARPPGNAVLGGRRRHKQASGVSMQGQATNSSEQEYLSPQAVPSHSGRSSQELPPPHPTPHGPSNHSGQQSVTPGTGTHPAVRSPEQHHTGGHNAEAPRLASSAAGEGPASHDGTGGGVGERYGGPRFAGARPGYVHNRPRSAAECTSQHNAGVDPQLLEEVCGDSRCATVQQGRREEQPTDCATDDTSTAHCRVSQPAAATDCTSQQTWRDDQHLHMQSEPGFKEGPQRSPAGERCEPPAASDALRGQGPAASNPKPGTDPTGDQHARGWSTEAGALTTDSIQVLPGTWPFHATTPGAQALYLTTIVNPHTVLWAVLEPHIPQRKQQLHRTQHTQPAHTAHQGTEPSGTHSVSTNAHACGRCTVGASDQSQVHHGCHAMDTICIGQDIDHLPTCGQPEGPGQLQRYADGRRLLATLLGTGPAPHGRIKVYKDSRLILGVQDDFIYLPSGRLVARIIRGGSVGVHCMHVFDYRQSRMRLLCRMYRGQLLPTTTWLFPPRSETHTQSSWWFECAPHSHDPHLEPGVYVLLAGFATLRFETVSAAQPRHLQLEAPQAARADSFTAWEQWKVWLSGTWGRLLHSLGYW